VTEWEAPGAFTRRYQLFPNNVPGPRRDIVKREQGKCHDTLLLNVTVYPDEGQSDERRIGRGTVFARVRVGAADVD